MGAETQEKQLRVQSSRSSSGCQTCKHRHVKCDEGRPYCQRCLKSKRHCEYNVEGNQESTKKFIIYSLPRNLSRTPDLGDLEKRALHYLRSQAALQITAPFQSELWKDRVFQLAESHDFVRSALVALSSMHESYTRDADLQDRLWADAIHHYNKTIRRITQAQDAELPVVAVLMTAIVFHSLDSLRGCFLQALQHAQSGIKIVGEQLLPPGPHQLSPMDEALYRDFLALQNQIREFGNPGISRAFDTFKAFSPPSVDRFQSAEEALYHLNVVYNEIYCLMDYGQALQESGGVALADVFVTQIQPRFETITNRFGRWSLGLDRLGALLDTGPDTSQQQAFLLLRIYQSVFTAMLGSFPTGDCFNRYDQDLARALELIEVFLKNEGRETYSRTAFTLSFGVIPALFAIAWRSNDSILRDKSLELLRLNDRREGVWDSKLALQLAQRYISLKDQVTELEGYTSDSIQISEICFFSENICRMTCVYVEAEALTAGAALPFEGVMGERRHFEIIQLDLS